MRVLEVNNHKSSLIGSRVDGLTYDIKLMLYRSLIIRKSNTQPYAIWVLGNILQLCYQTHLIQVPTSFIYFY